MKLAVIGCGYWGKNLVRNLGTMGALKWVCDLDLEQARLHTDGFPLVQATTDYQDVLNDPEVEGVVIASPAVTHFQHAQAAFEAGKHVYVEKPLAQNLSDGEALVRLAREKNRILMVGHILRYHPAVIRLCELVRSGALGALQYLYSNRLNIGKIRTEENILWSFAPHDISVMLAVLGAEPQTIACSGGSYLEHDLADVTLSQFRFANGVRAHIHVSWLHPFKEQRLVVIGSEKMAVFDDTAEHKLVLYPHKVEWNDAVPTAVKADAEIVDLQTTEPLRAECEHFLHCIKSGEQPVTDGAEGLRVLRILDACQRSLEQQGVPVEWLAAT